MSTPVSAYKDRQFLAVIGDEVGSFVFAALPRNINHGYRTLSLAFYLQALA
jgi:hypothetical protein